MFMPVCSDEIYANSVFREAEEFVSLASLLEESEPDLKRQAQALCHVVFGLSKDWYAVLGRTTDRRLCDSSFVAVAFLFRAQCTCKGT